MRKDRHPCRCVAESILIAAGVWATAGLAEATAQEPDSELDEVVVTASRLGVGLPGASTTVIEAEDISRSPARTLPELLGREAGVQNRDLFGAAGAKSTVDIRRLRGDGVLQQP